MKTLKANGLESADLTQTAATAGKTPTLNVLGINIISAKESVEHFIDLLGWNLERINPKAAEIMVFLCRLHETANKRDLMAS